MPKDVKYPRSHLSFLDLKYLLGLPNSLFNMPITLTMFVKETQLICVTLNNLCNNLKAGGQYNEPWPLCFSNKWHT